MRTKRRRVLAVMAACAAVAAVAATFAAGLWGAPGMSARETSAWLEMHSPPILFDFECRRKWLAAWDYQCTYAVRGQDERETRFVRVDGDSVIEETAP